MSAFSEFRQLLKSPIWGFSLRSLFTRYGQFFLWRMAFAHPVRLYRALVRFPQLSLKLTRTGYVATDDRAANGYDLVAGSFCQKPFDCPVGRFNHRCLKAETVLDRVPRACQGCPLGQVAAVAAAQGSDFYVMTSALDIAHDLFLPNLRFGRWKRALFVLCPYSAQPFLLAMLVAGLEGVLVTFCCGDCRSYRDFALADRGVKTEQTRVETELWRRFLAVPGELSGRLRKEGNLYVA